jgi:D-glutamate cyclase
MRGHDITDHFDPDINAWAAKCSDGYSRSIGIGDGGNEIGMGRIAHDTIAANIPNGDRVHCRVPTDHLLVAGVSNWGAYALAAGVFVLRGVTPPAELFDPVRERAILEAMVAAGPLVDGVTGEATATVDGLPWDVYAEPLGRIRDILFRAELRWPN